jgi:hypothetical protein
LHHDNAPPYTYFFTGEFFIKTTWLLSPTHPKFLFPRLSLKQKGSQFDSWGDGGRITGGAEHPHRTRLPGRI